MPAGLFCDVIMKQKEDFFSQKAYVSLFFLARLWRMSERQMDEQASQKKKSEIVNFWYQLKFFFSFFFGVESHFIKYLTFGTNAHTFTFAHHI